MYTGVCFFFHSLIHEILLILLYFVLWLMIFVCTWCSCWYVLISFHSGLLLLFFAHTCHLVGGIVFFHLVAHAHRPIPTHIAIVLRWHASLHTEMLVGGGWCWLDDVQRFTPRRKWLHFGDPGVSNSMFLLILFISQSGSCTRRPPRSCYAVFCRIDDQSRRT